MFETLCQHGVTRLCHFTKLQSLTHILLEPDGIKATSKIDKDKLNQIDSVRADGKLDYVCCSIEYPNSWFLSNAKSRNVDEIFRDWAIMFINPEIVKIRGVCVCECNAARDNGAHIRKGDSNSISDLFANRVCSFQYPRTANMLSACPTNSQSEILIKDGIPRDYITGIAVGNEETAKMVYAMRKTLEVETIDIYISPRVVTTAWRTDIQNGIRPQEIKYNG